MTEEQLNKEAEEYADKVIGVAARYNSGLPGFVHGKIHESYKAGYRSRDKEVEDWFNLCTKLQEDINKLEARLRGDD